jgi:hypothetical protein
MVICFAPSAVLMVLMVPDAAIPGLANRKVARQDVRVVVRELYLPTMGVTLLKRWRRLRCWLWWPRQASGPRLVLFAANLGPAGSPELDTDFVVLSI